ncbi:MAG: hypothetical protein PHS36_03790 [Candidatus Cloacimonetes bacterium]|jgi:hypothetical protein|nr:hypothetical protein [Candidatus Cloacimonadota bacterium]
MEAMKVIIGILMFLIVSCSSNNTIDSGWYRVLDYNILVLDQNGVMIVEDHLHHLSAVVIPFPANNKETISRNNQIRIGGLYKLTLEAIPDSTKFQRIYTQKSKGTNDYFDTGVFEYKGKPFRYFDAQSEMFLIPVYYTEDVHAIWSKHRE